ncbi:enoyl-CoA hydratase/isomerase family protein [Polaromonas sp. P1(28)-13]|nr:enoyl-CoA hydratase/isomerase family protein [Polaromonas sp. P1(28)-13]
MDDKLLVEQRGALLWVTFNRPEKANALTGDMLQRAADAIVAAGHNADVRAVLVSGTGECFFSAGVDVREKPEDGDEAAHKERRSAAHAAFQDALIDVEKPVVAVLNGTAIGGGAMWALLADACVAVDSAELSLPEIDIGIATFSGANILEVLGGRALALDLIQSGRRMPAREAQLRGLINAVAARDDLPQTAAGLAEILGSKHRQAFADNKRWINRSLKTALAEAQRGACAAPRSGRPLASKTHTGDQTWLILKFR